MPPMNIRPERREVHAELARRIGPGLGLGLVFLARDAGKDIEDHRDIGDRLALVVDHLARDRRST